MSKGIYKINKERESCWICLKGLSLRQEKFCSKKCSNSYSGRVKNKKLLEVRAIKRQNNLKPLGKKVERPKILDKIPSLVKPGKGKNFKLKKVLLTKSNNLPRKRYIVNRSKQGRSDKTESEIWKWFWDIKFNIEPLEKELKPLFNYYKWKHHTEKFISNKAHDNTYLLFTPNNLKID